MPKLAQVPNYIHMPNNIKQNIITFNIIRIYYKIIKTNYRISKNTIKL